MKQYNEDDIVNLFSEAKNPEWKELEGVLSSFKKIKVKLDLDDRAKWRSFTFNKKTKHIEIKDEDDIWSKHLMHFTLKDLK